MDHHTDNLRRGIRARVIWDAEFRVNRGFALGLMRDVSGCGAFFVPTTEFLGEVAWNSGDLSYFVHPGDRIVLNYAEKADAPARQVPATVRWVGNHGQTGDWGVGVQFDGA